MRFKMNSQVRQCFGNLCAALISVSCLVLLSVGAIRICLWLSFSPEQVKMLEPCVPVLEKLIWPLFILFLIFLFKKQIVVIIHELPLIIRRSSLPGAQLVARDIISDNHGNGIVDGEISKHMEGFNQIEHDKKVDNLLSYLEDEIDCRITRNARIGNTTTTANGAVVFAGQLYYIAVLPEIFKDRIVAIVSRMKELLDRNEKNSMPILIICMYGDKLRMTRDELSGFRIPTKFPVVIRCFDESNI